MTVLARYYRVLHLSEAIGRLRAGSLSARSVCITFDDGYADNYLRALPILRRHGLVATFFVSSAFIDGGRMWNDTVIEALRHHRDRVLDLDSIGLGRHAITTPEARGCVAARLIEQLKYLPYDKRIERVAAIEAIVGRTLPHDLMMSGDQVRGLVEQGMAIGGHTMTHPILSRIDNATARREISAGKEKLQSITGESVDLFAYPNGQPGVDYDARHVEMVRAAGFMAAVSTHRGVAQRCSDLFQLPRFAPWDRRPARFLMRLVQCRFQPSYHDDLSELSSRYHDEQRNNPDQRPVG